uniref:Fatty acid-binding protein n=1 Tax=Tyrophagus putrescentiae TaxID=59818 RepID=A7XZL4_TYRPU|nr:allergen Tyr p 13 [Tyrophagus putrescentiae]
MVQLNGSYKLEKSDNFDAFLKELGVNFVTRNLAKSASPTVEVIVDGDSYTIKTSSTLKNSEIKFKLGEEFEEDRADGKKVQTSVTKEGDNKLVQVQKGDKPVTIVREFSEEGLTVTATVNGATSVRFYKRQ